MFLSNHGFSCCWAAMCLFMASGYALLFPARISLLSAAKRGSHFYGKGASLWTACWGVVTEPVVQLSWDNHRFAASGPRFATRAGCSFSGALGEALFGSSPTEKNYGRLISPTMQVNLEPCAAARSVCCYRRPSLERQWPTGLQITPPDWSDHLLLHLS